MRTYKITQTETHFAKAENKKQLLDLLKNGALDCPQSIDTEITEVEETLKRYTILSGTIYEIEATSKKEAMKKLSEGVDIEEGEAHSDFYGSQPCDKCEGEWGWHEDDDAGITFSGLKQAQNEAILKGIAYAMEYLEEINYHDGANALAEFWDFLYSPDSTKMPDYQSNFHAGHTLYSTKCEGAN